MTLSKITKNESERRSYDDACATAHALDLIGERWALLVMRELMMGPRRFSDLRASLPTLSANVLTQRLGGLEAAGIVRKRKLPPPAGVQVYELTDWGQEAEPVLLALGRWGVRSPLHDPTMPLSAVGLMLSFRAKFDAVKAKGVSVMLAMRFGYDVFSVGVQKGALVAARGEPAEAHADIAGDPAGVAGLVYGKAPLKDLERAGLLSVTGDRAALKRFADLWEMPPKAELPEAQGR